MKKKNVLICICVSFFICVASLLSAYIYINRHHLSSLFLVLEDEKNTLDPFEYQDTSDFDVDKINKIEDIKSFAKNVKEHKELLNPFERKFIVKLENVEIIDLLIFVSELSNVGLSFDEKILEGIKTTIIAKTPISLETMKGAVVNSLRSNGLEITESVPGILTIQKSFDVTGALSSFENKSSSFSVTHVFQIENIDVQELARIMQPPLISKSCIINFIDFSKDYTTEHDEDTKNADRLSGSPFRATSKYRGAIIVTDDKSNIDKIGKLIFALDHGAQNIKTKRFHPENLSTKEIYMLFINVFASEMHENALCLIIPKYEEKYLLLIGSTTSVLRTEALLNSIDNIDLVDMIDNYPALSDRYMFKSRRIVNSDSKKIVEYIKNKSQDFAEKNKSLHSDMNSINHIEGSNTVVYFAKSEENQSFIASMIDSIESLKQIHVDMLIVSVDESKMSGLGIDWEVSSEINPITKNNFARMHGAETDVSPAGFSTGFIGSVLSIRNKPIFSISAIANILSKDSDSRILAQPFLGSVEGEKAEIFVGTTIPVITDTHVYQSGTANLGLASSQTTTTINVGTRISFIAYVCDDGMIKIEIDHEISTVDEASSYKLANYPALSTSRSHSCIFIPDDSVFVMGGLSLESSYKEVVGTPCASSFCGALRSLARFAGGRSRSTKSKKNILIFVKPKIIYNKIDQMEIQSNKYKRIHGSMCKEQYESMLLNKFWGFIDKIS